MVTGKQVKYWEAWEKPWSTKQCREVYVEVGGFSLTDIAKASGNPAGNVRRWSQQGKWGEAQKEWQARRFSEQRKEKLKIFNKLVLEVRSKHREVWQYSLEVSQILASHIARRASQEQLSLRDLSILASANNNIVNSLKTAIAGEIEAWELNYLDPNKIAELAHKQGLVVYEIEGEENIREIIPEIIDLEDFRDLA